MKKISSSFIIGIFFIIAGVILCLNTMGFTLNLDRSVIWWSLLALAGVAIMINEKRPTIIPSLMMVVGIWNVLKACGIITTSVFTLIWPIILIVIGINLMFSQKLFTKTRATQDKDGILTYNGVFGGVTEKLNTKDFKGLNANAVFGAVELDLRNIEVQQKEVYIDAATAFGGITFLMPEQYNIITTDSMGILGGTENKFSNAFDENKNTIYLSCKAVFGGIEIK